MSQVALKQTRKPLVLVVDDEETIRQTLSKVFQDENYETLLAGDGVEALEKVREFQPELVFLDMWMPGWDGIETLERIKAEAPRTEVIMISGHASISNALEATRRGAFDFIEKPLDIEGIMLSASRALERHGLSCAAAEETENLSTTLFKHPGLLSQGMAGRNLGQRTIKSSIILYGQGVHSGQKSGLVLEPLPLNSGIHFGQIGMSRTAPAFVDNVDSTAFATTIRSPGMAVSTVEHLMSALHAYRISNLLIKCNGEVPIFDGSALEFCKVLEEVGIEEQGGNWFEVAVDRPFTIHDESTEKHRQTLTIEPAEEFSVEYVLDYPAPVGRQQFEFRYNGLQSYRDEIAPARTFGFMKDIERLQKAGLAAGGRLDNFILIGGDGVVNTELRFADELVRHKILDIIGDLFLLGRPLRGKIRGAMTGHSDNVLLLRAMREAAIR